MPTGSAATTRTLSTHRRTLRFVTPANLGHRGAKLHPGVHVLASIDDRVDQTAEQELHATQRVVIARNRNVDQIGIAIRVEDPDHGHVHLRGFLDRDVLMTRVDHDHRTRQTLQRAHTAEVAADLAHLATQHRLPLLAVLRQRSIGLEPLEFVEPVETTADRVVVGQRAANPPLRNNGHSHPLGLTSGDILDLPLGADEQDLRASGSETEQEMASTQQPAHRLTHIDDVDQVFLSVDVAPHLGVPQTRLVSEVNTRLD